MFKYYEKRMYFRYEFQEHENRNILVRIETRRKEIYFILVAAVRKNRVVIQAV